MNKNKTPEPSVAGLMKAGDELVPARQPVANIAPFGLRMQPDLKERVEKAAADNNRSMNSEIIARLEASFGMEMPLVQGAVNTAQMVKALAEALSQSNEFIEDLAKQFEERNITQIKHRAKDDKKHDK